MTDTTDDIPVLTSVADAPNFYADILYHVTWLNGVARLAFIRNHADVGQTVWEGQHVVSLSLPMGSVVMMRDYLNDIIAGWEKAAEESGTK